MSCGFPRTTSARLAFTVGLWHSHRQPELAIFGLDIGTMKACLNVLGRQAADGWPPELDYERSHVIDGDPVLFKTIEPRWYKAFFGTALAFYRRPPIPFVQVLWLTATSDSPPTPNASRRCVTGNPASGSDLTSILKVPGPKMSDSRSGRDHRASIHRAFGYDAIHPELYPAGGLVNDHNAKPSQYGSSPISDGPPMRTCRVDRGM